MDITRLNQKITEASIKVSEAEEALEDANEALHELQGQRINVLRDIAIATGEAEVLLTFKTGGQLVGHWWAPEGKARIGSLAAFFDPAGGFRTVRVEFAELHFIELHEPEVVVDTSAKVVGLSWSNVKALEELRDRLPSLVEITNTTATFKSAEAGYLDLLNLIDTLPGRGHPRASLHAVKRRLDALRY